MYADVEENFGLYNRAIDIYDRALRQLGKDETLELLKIVIAKTSKFFGLAKTRKVYEVDSDPTPFRKPLKLCRQRSFSRSA